MHSKMIVHLRFENCPWGGESTSAALARNPAKAASFADSHTAGRRSQRSCGWSGSLSVFS